MATLVLHAIAASLIVLLVVASIVLLLILIQRWHRFSPERKRAIHIWTVMIMGGAYFLGAWDDLVQGSTSFSTAFICLCFTAMMVNFLRQRPKPQPWEQAPPNVVLSSLWELASTRYRVGAAVIVALGLSAGIGLLALAAL